MSYFLGTDKIEKINDNNLDDIECVAQYKSTIDFIDLQTSNITVKNHTISTYCPYRDAIKSHISIGKFEIQELGKQLPSAPDESLTFIEVFKNKCWENRIKLIVVENKYTLLSIRDENDMQNMKFDNDAKVLLFDHVFYMVNIKVSFNDNYLAIAIGDFDDGSKKWKKKINPQTYFIFIKIVESDTNENILSTMFTTRLDEQFPKFWLGRIVFNMNFSTKILLIMRNRISKKQKKNSKFLITFNVNTKTLSSPFEFPFSFDLYICMYCFLCSHNILKDLLVMMDPRSSMVYVLKESLEGCLYIHKKTSIPIPDWCYIGDVYCCNNRNNEIILLLTIHNEREEDLDEESFLYERLPILVYDVINHKIHKKFYNGNGERIRTGVEIFFNRTGEQIFIADKDILNVFVYKSKVHSLKRICQLVVLQQYSSKQIDEMNLPKYILESD